MTVWHFDCTVQLTLLCLQNLEEKYVLDISACCVIIHNILIPIGDYGVLDCAEQYVVRDLSVMKAEIYANFEVGVQQQMVHFDLGHIACNTHPFYTSENCTCFVVQI